MTTYSVPGPTGQQCHLTVKSPSTPPAWFKIAKIAAYVLSGAAIVISIAASAGLSLTDLGALGAYLASKGLIAGILLSGFTYITSLSVNQYFIRRHQQTASRLISDPSNPIVTRLNSVPLYGSPRQSASLVEQATDHAIELAQRKSLTESPLS